MAEQRSTSTKKSPKKATAPRKPSKSNKVKRARAAVRKGGKKRQQFAFGRIITSALMLAILLFVGYRITVSDLGSSGSRIAPSALPEQEETNYPYAISGFRKSRGRMCYDDMEFTTETGIDVSSYQGSIDWSMVASDGISFALVRAGYRGYGDGELYEDDRFVENLRGSQAAGLKTGVYYFSQAITEEEARAEAQHVLELLNGAHLELPVYIDWEYIIQDESRTRGLDGNTMGACCRAFCEELQAAGYSSGVYMSSYLLDSIINQDAIAELPIWMAEYSGAPTCLTNYQIWQYTDSGSVEGVSVQVDLNLRFIPVD